MAFCLTDDKALSEPMLTKCLKHRTSLRNTHFYNDDFVSRFHNCWEHTAKYPFTYMDISCDCLRIAKLPAGIRIKLVTTCNNSPTPVGIRKTRGKVKQVKHHLTSVCGSIFFVNDSLIILTIRKYRNITMVSHERHVIFNHRLFVQLLRAHIKETPNSALLSLCEGVPRWPVSSPQKDPYLTRKRLYFYDIVMKYAQPCVNCSQESVNDSHTLFGGCYPLPIPSGLIEGLIRWLSARLQYLQCVSIGDAAVLR